MWASEKMTLFNKINIELFCFLLPSIWLIGGVACIKNEKEKLAGGPYYYERVEMKRKADFPLRPVRPLSKEAAKAMRAYGIAYYDDRGRIVSYSKIFEGELLWTSKFFYNSSGFIEKEEYIDLEKNLTIKYFDKYGHLITKKVKESTR